MTVYVIAAKAIDDVKKRRFPGAARSEARRSGALQTQDRCILRSLEFATIPDQRRTASAKQGRAKIPRVIPTTRPFASDARFSLQAAPRALSSLSDRLRSVLPEAGDRRGQIDVALKRYRHRTADLILAPSRGSSAENVTGGLAQACPP
jgi:hypothetical protein